MAVFRFLAALFLLVATIALVADATPWVYNAGPFTATSLGAHWKEMGATSLAAAESTVTAVAGPWVWQSLIGAVLDLPTFVFFGVLALFSGYAGRRRKRVRVFVN